jgi:DNA (cytosine-5)-methyltransferase 1
MNYTPGYHSPETLRFGYQGQIYDELIVDNFAGGGGASTGIELAIGRPVDIAINHDPAALAMHKVNHPWTRHYCESVWDVNPREITAGRPVGLAWFSPDCTHHSKARGGKPRDKNVRGLAWVVLRWAATVRPRVICLENVEEFKTWGKLLPSGKPDPKHKGRTFQTFVNALKHHGYAVEWRELKAHEYGAPTTRKRLFMVARCDGLPVVFPTPTHGVGRQKVRTAAECIDWSIPTTSIFARAKPLAGATCRRIARGITKFVLEHPNPFIVAIGYGEREGQKPRINDVDNPLGTIVSVQKHALVCPSIIRYHGEKSLNENRAISLEQPITTQTTENRCGLVVASITKFQQKSVGAHLEQPLDTVMAGAARFGLVAAHVTKFQKGNHGSDPDAPLDTITAQTQKHAVVTAFIAKHYGGPNGQQPPGFLPREPLHTITADDHHAVVTATLEKGNGELVAAFLHKYYGQGLGQEVTKPCDTITTKDRFGLVTVTIDGEQFVIADIGMRMLQPKELFAAQGFPENYVIEPMYNGKKFSKSLQVRMVGNSVCPDVAKAIVMANYVQPALAQAADD